MTLPIEVGLYHGTLIQCPHPTLAPETTYGPFHYDKREEGKLNTAPKGAEECSCRFVFIFVNNGSIEGELEK